MSIPPTRSRYTTCVLPFFILISMLVIVVVIVPAFITAQAEKTFGPPSPELSVARRIYLSGLILFQSNDLTNPVDADAPEVNILINQGESVPSIIGKLWEAGLINNPGVFSSYLQYSGLDTTLKSGEYILSSGLTPIELALKMQSSVSPNIIFSILPGWRLEEVASAFPGSGLNITKTEFIQATKSKPEGYSFSSCQESASLEGFLFPSSYTVPRETTLDELLTQILMGFESAVTSELKDGFSTQGLDLCQAVTLASIIQREAVVKDEMPLIASVFYNRLNVGMALESDPTVQYAVGYNQKQTTWWTNPLSVQDLRTHSPYNTYVYAGLPPGPISNPGLEAMQSVAFPATTPYFYFRSACDGSGRHAFAETFEEHLANECP